MVEKSKKITVDLWSPFSASELDAKAQEMSNAVIQYDTIEDEKKDSGSEYTKLLKNLRGEMRVLSKQIRARGAERPVECVVHFHTPRVAIKRIYRLDTNDLVREEAMTPDECQMNLFEGREVAELEKMYGKDEPPAQPGAPAA